MDNAYSEQQPLRKQKTVNFKKRKQAAGSEPSSLLQAVHKVILGGFSVRNLGRSIRFPRWLSKST